MAKSGIPNQSLLACELFDSILRWKIPSRHDPKDEHVVELAHFNGHGECQCKDFVTRFGPLLAKGIDPETAYHEGLVEKLRPYQLGPEDALSCWHLVQARRQCARHVVRAFVKIQRAQQPPGEEGRQP